MAPVPLTERDRYGILYNGAVALIEWTLTHHDHSKVLRDYKHCKRKQDFAKMLIVASRGDVEHKSGEFTEKI